MDDIEAGGSPGMQPQAEESTGGYEICIRVGADGALSVGVEREGAEAAQAMPPGGGQPMEMMAAGEEAAYQPAGSIKEALTMALEIYRADGQMPDDGGQADFDSGYTSRMPV